MTPYDKIVTKHDRIKKAVQALTDCLEGESVTWIMIKMMQGVLYMYCTSVHVQLVPAARKQENICHYQKIFMQFCNILINVL